MKGIRAQLGTFALVMLFFGGAAWALTRELGLFAALNLAGGTAALVGFFGSGSGDLGNFFGRRSTRHGANAVLYSVLIAAIIGGLNFLGTRYAKRFDLTEENVFSLSPQSTQVVRELTDELELIAFVEGGNAPGLQDLFENFAREADGKVRYQLVDPDQSPELAEQYSISAYNQVRVAYGEQKTTVTAPTEESLTNAIIKVTQAETKTLCFVTGHGEPSIEDAESPGGYASLAEALRNESYEVREIVLATRESDPAECSALIVPSPERDYVEGERERLAGLLANGMPAVLLFSGRPGPSLGSVLEPFGIAVGEDVIIDQVVRLFEGPQLGLDPIAEDYGSHPITEGFHERTIFPLSRSVEPLGPHVQTLVRTSESSWAESDVERVFGEGKVTLDPSADRRGPVSIAVAADLDPSIRGAGDGPSRIVAIGSTGFANNKYLTSFFNRDLAMNAVGWTVGEDTLVSVRARTIRASTVALTRDQVMTIFYLSVLILPEALLLLGIAVWARRRSA